MSSNFARQHARVIAIAASLGLITCRHPTGIFCQAWLITPRGLIYIHEQRVKKLRRK